MPTFTLFAHPWWVNLLILVPFLAYWSWRSPRLLLSWRQLLFSGLFALGFGFVEASVVVYLGTVVQALPGATGTLAEAARNSSALYDQARVAWLMPRSLLAVEVPREGATILVLISVALLAAGRWRERWAVFLWTFAIWDIVYYLGLCATIHWPSSLLNADVLFLIPVPWLAQVWFPLAVSGLTLLAVMLGKIRGGAAGRTADLRLRSPASSPAARQQPGL